MNTTTSLLTSRKMKTKIEETGVDVSTSCWLVSATPLVSETFGAFLISVIKMAEVGRYSIVVLSLSLSLSLCVCVCVCV